MRVLAIETSTRQGSIALLEENELVLESVLPLQRRTTETLAPAMKTALRDAGWGGRDVGLVAVTNGPGSFTGLRIAVTAAKTFAFAVGAKLVALDTLRVLVEQIEGTAVEACAVMDAQRSQLFSARFRREPGGSWERLETCQIIERGALAEQLTDQSVVTGPVLARLDPALLGAARPAAQARWAPRASTVGQLGYQAHLAGQLDDPFSLLPQYYRPSYAEEKRQ